MNDLYGGQGTHDFYAAPGARHGAPAPTPAAANHTAGVPETVAVAYTVLAVFAAVGLYLAVTLASVSAQIGSYGSDSNGLGATEFWYGSSGVLGLVLIYFLRTGSTTARIVAAALAACWGAYWLYEFMRAIANSSDEWSGGFIGAGGTVGMLGGLLVVGASFLVPALLWTSSAKRHFVS